MTDRIPLEAPLARLCSLADTSSSRPLITFLDSGEEFTARGLLDGVLLWAAAFSRLGVQPGMAVATMVPASADGYLTWLGVSWLRGVEVPMNLDYRGSLLVHVLNSSGAQVVVCTSEYTGRLAEVAAQAPSVQTLVVLDDGPVADDIQLRVVRRGELLDGVTPLLPTDPPGASDIAAVVYTSGTTGPSKGVAVAWRLLSGYLSYPAHLEGDAFRLYSPWPLFHVTGKFTLVEAINRSGTVFVRSRWKTDAFWSDVRQNGITAALSLGGISYFLWAQEPREDDADNPLQYLTMSPLIPEFREFKKRFNLEISTGYASSESGTPLTGHPPVPNDKTCGRLNPEYEIKLVDLEGHEVGPNVPGEALIRAVDGDLMFKGYWNMPEATEKAWEGGWFHSGDGLMRDEDGLYYFVDRVKDSLRRRGENISSWELEGIVNSHPYVLESAAIAVPSSAVDDDIMIVVVLNPGASLSGRELIEFMVSRTPRFMIPRYVRFVPDLPKTITGRVQKARLRDAGVTADVWDGQPTRTGR